MNELIQICMSIPWLALAPPQASPMPKSWNLAFEYSDPQRITVAVPGHDEPRTFWYLLYTVVNDSGRDVEFYPSFEIMTGSGMRLPSELGVSPVVITAIKKRHAKTHPFLQGQTEIIGRLLQTKDQAKDGVAVWPDFSASSSRFTVFVTGLSGESADIPNPGFQPDKPRTIDEKLADGTTIPRVVNPKVFTLHRTLAIHYDLPGDVQTRASATPVRTGQEWVMR
jgi:hypothetical protein